MTDTEISNLEWAVVQEAVKVATSNAYYDVPEQERLWQAVDALIAARERIEGEGTVANGIPT